MPRIEDYEVYYEPGPDGEVRQRWRPKAGVIESPAPADAPTTSSAADVSWHFPHGFSAKRMADRLREETFFAVGGGTLHVFRGGCYRPTGDSFVRARTTDVLGERWTRRCADETIAFMSSSSPELWERPPRDVLNVKNGLLAIETGRLDEHSPNFLSSVQVGAAYDPRASCPLIEQFVADVFPSDATDLAYELAGYLMAPDASFELAVMLLGGGSNGKSTYLSLLAALLGGSANVSAATLQSLDGNRFSAAQLYGKLANIVADLDAEAVKSSGVFKAIVSGDLVQAERKYGAPFQFRPFARLLFSANEPPPTHDSTFAYFRRWLIIPFIRTFIGSSRDRELGAKLTTQEELSGFLNMAVEGLRRVRRRGAFTDAPSLKEAAKAFRSASDSAAAFVDEECALGAGLRIRQAELYESYKQWCERVGRSNLSARRFNDRVRSMLPDPLVATVRRDGYDYWQGITLRRELGSGIYIGECVRCRRADEYLKEGVCKPCEGQEG